MESVKLELMKFNKENVYVDLNDVLDIFETEQKGHYTVVFDAGEIWFNVTMRKTVFNKFEKLSPNSTLYVPDFIFSLLLSNALYIIFDSFSN